MKLRIIKKQKGFTMIELVIVIAILGILASFVLPRMINLRNQASIASANSIVSSLEVSMSIAKTKFQADRALGSTTTTVDLDNNPTTTNDRILMAASTGNINMSPMTNNAACQRFIDTLLPNKNDMLVSFRSPRGCTIQDRRFINYMITINQSANVSVMYF